MTSSGPFSRHTQFDESPNPPAFAFADSIELYTAEFDKISDISSREASPSTSHPNDSI